MKKLNSEAPGHITTGNVLDDLGLSPVKSLEAKMKYQVHEAILDHVKKHKLTSRELEKKLDKQQPRVSDLLNGKISKVSLTLLFRYLSILEPEADVELTISKSA